MTVVYQLILAFIVIILFWEMFTQKDFAIQVMAAMTIIPFLLRLFMVV